MVLVAAVALGSSTYAWFVNNAQVTATNVNVTATTAYSLQIKKGADGNYGTTTDLNGAVTLKPVSTVGALATTSKTLSKNTATGGSASNAVGIGDDTTVAANDMVFFTSDSWNSNAEVVTFKEVSRDSKHSYVNGPSNATGESEYFYSDTVYLKAGQASKIYLDNTTTGIYDTTLTKFSAVTDNATKALLETMRVGFVVTQGSGESIQRRVYIYQLNATSSGTGYNYNTTMSNANGLTTATNSENSVAALASVNNYHTSTGDTDPNPTGIIALTDSVMATGAQTSMATAPTTDAAKNTLATVAANEEIQVDIYMWMEGCDYDTTAANSAQFQTTIQGIQFGFCIGAA